MLILQNNRYEIVIANDSSYLLDSIDNLRSYDTEYLLGDKSVQPSSQHSVVVKDNSRILRTCILLADGGATGIQQQSALIHHDSCIVAVGPFLCSLCIPTLELELSTKVDFATCFGVYYSEKHNCFISHGELVIARVEHDGKLLWQSGGKDIFTNGFELHDDHIETIDFNDERYCVNMQTGTSKLI